MIVGRWLFIGFPRAKVLGAGMECGASCYTLPGNKLVINLELHELTSLAATATNAVDMFRWQRSADSALAEFLPNSALPQAFVAENGLEGLILRLASSA